MADPYLLLTPVLALAVLALAGFIGCNWFYGLDETVLEVPPPDGLVATPGDGRVDLSWFYQTGTAIEFTVLYGTQLGGPYPSSLVVQPSAGNQHLTPVAPLTNGTTYFFRVTARTEDGASAVDDSPEVSATPGVTSFVVSKVLGSNRNDFQGWVGMRIQVGPAAVTVTQLGRIVGPGNTGPHVVKIVDPGSNDADLGSVTLIMPAAPVGQFAYAILVPPVMLIPFGLYYVVSHEEAGGDIWHDLPTAVVTTSVGSVLSGVFSDDASPGFMFAGSAGQTYVPVDFRY